MSLLECRISMRLFQGIIKYFLREFLPFLIKFNNNIVHVSN